MTSVFFRLAFTFLLTLSANAVFAQDTLSRGAWIERVFTLVYADVDLTNDEEIWVKESLIAMCECSWVEPKEKGVECGEEFLKREELPMTEEDFEVMTPEQERKFLLLSPLFSTLGKCPK